jgi:predicted secreted protein
VNNGTGRATIAVMPKLQVLGSGASCAVTASDNTAQVATVPVQIGQTFTPAASGASIAFSAGAAAAVSLTEQNYDVAPAYGARGGFSFVGYLANGSASLTSTYSSDPNGVCSGASGPSSASLGNPNYTEVEAWSVSFAKAGVCWPVFADVYGQRVIVNGSAGLKATASFKTWPASLVVGGGDARMLNALLGGGIALAAGTYTGPCYAQAYQSGTSGAIDTSIFSQDPAAAAALGVSVTTDGCILNAAGTEPYGWNGSNGTGRAGRLRTRRQRPNGDVFTATNNGLLQLRLLRRLDSAERVGCAGGVTGERHENGKLRRGYQR